MTVQHEENRIGMLGDTFLKIGDVDYGRGSDDGFSCEETF